MTSMWQVEHELFYKEQTFRNYWTFNKYNHKKLRTSERQLGIDKLHVNVIHKRSHVIIFIFKIIKFIRSV